ncbi:hypothetical protein IKZ77_03055, partial [Candidatus Saccharibacteria bacterium]|nr:hypothetical protein [Candidatus Saccharibacteria bacterium]
KIPDSLNEEDKEELKRLIDESSALISFYFISTILVDTNESYNYYLEHKNFDNFLSNYGYPVGEFEDAGILNNFKVAIERLYSRKEFYYNTILQADCIRNNNEGAYIDYDCLNGNMEINNAQGAILDAQIVVDDYSSKMPSLILAYANNMRSIVDGDNE